MALPTLDELNGVTTASRSGEAATHLPTLEELNGEAKLPTLEELNGETKLPTLEELNGEASKKPEISVAERMKLEKEAELGHKLSGLEATAHYLPVVGKMMDSEQNRQEAVEKRLAMGEVNDPLEMIKLAQTIGVDQKAIDELVAKADTGARTIAGFKMNLNADVLREGFKNLVLPRYDQRIREREAAQAQLDAAANPTTWQKIAKGMAAGASMVAEFSNPATLAMGTAGNIMKRVDALGKDQYAHDKDGNLVLVKKGDQSEATMAGAIAGGIAEQTIWTSPIVGKIFGMGGKALAKIPGVNKLAAGALKGVAGMGEQAVKKLSQTEGGRLLLKTGEVLGKIEDKVHVGSLPNMVLKSRVTELLDDVVGLNRQEGERESFGEWLDKMTSIDDNLELLTGIIGIHALATGTAVIKAHGQNKAFRGAREEVLGEYLSKQQIKTLSNEDIDNLYRIVTSDKLTPERVNQFLDTVKADRSAAEARMKNGETPEQVIESWKQKNANSQTLIDATGKIVETLEGRREITPEMEARLDEKIDQYALGDAQKAEMIKQDIRNRLQDNRVLEEGNEDMLDEMVAMSTRNIDPEARRVAVHDLRGDKNVGEQVAGIEGLGVTSWEQAEQEGLITKDTTGHYKGGARQALNIEIHGTEALKGAVKDGTVSGDTAEALMTTAQCELGARPVEEQAALIDGVLERSKGDEAMARRMMTRLAEEGVEAGADVGKTLDRIAEEVKAEAISERNGVDEATARGASVEPVETEDGKITTVGDIAAGGNGTTAVGGSPRPQTALEGYENAERLKGTELKSTGNGLMNCNVFPEMQLKVSAAGVEIGGIDPVKMAKPELAADMAAVVARAADIARRNGVKLVFDSEEAARTAIALLEEVKNQGLARAQKRLDTRAGLLGTLFKNGLGTSVTFDEGNFKKALASTANGRPFVDNHGNIYGFVDGEGGIHFNPAALRFDTPFHEYGHVARAMVEKVNPGLWKRGMDLIRETEYYREMAEMAKGEDHPYHGLSEDGLREDALCNLLGDRGAKLIEDKGVGAELKAWLKEFWKAVKGALGIADITEEQLEKMTLEQIADAINAELLRGSEFGAKKREALSKTGIRMFDEAEGSGSNGMLRWKNDRGYLFAIPVDLERTQPGGKVVLKTDDANITDWIQQRLNGVDLRMSKTGKLYVKGQNGLEGELAEIFGKYPTIGENDGLAELFASESMHPEYANATPDQLVKLLADDRAAYDTWKENGRKGVDAAQEEYYRQQAEAEEEAARQAFINGGGTAMDYLRERAMDREEAPFDLDWETMRELARDREQGRFAARRLIGGKETAVSEGYPLTLREARDPEKVVGVLGKLIGKSAAQIGQMKLTRITEKSVEHLLNSGHAKSDRTANGNAAKRLWRGTVAGMSVTDDIIGTSPLGTAEAPKHFNAAWKKGAKFYSADTRFAIELDNGQYEIYPCKLIVSEVNGERQVYDITEIGKPTLSAIPTAEAIVPGVPQRGLTANGGIGSQQGNSISNKGASGQVGKFAAGNGTWNRKRSFADEARIDKEKEKLVGIYGTTENFKEAGYIMPDGKMLDLSGRKLGARNVDGKRTVDHRDAPDEIGKRMEDLLNDGWIRIHPESGEINISTCPNLYAISKLEEFIDSFNGNVRVEISTPDGYHSAFGAYEEGTRASRVVNDIVYFDENRTLGKGLQPNGVLKFAVGGRSAAENLNREKDYENAERLLSRKGADRMYVWRQTGFWKGPDGKLRFEIPDGKLKEPKAIQQSIRTSFGRSVPLAKILDAPELFKAYPDLAYLEVRFGSDIDAAATYSPSTDTIKLKRSGILNETAAKNLERERASIKLQQKRLSNPEEMRKYLSNCDVLGIEHGTIEEERVKASETISAARERIKKLEQDADRSDNPEGLTSALMHEIQHAIQEREDFARGMTDKAARRFADDILKLTPADRKELEQWEQKYERNMAALAELQSRKYLSASGEYPLGSQTAKNLERFVRTQGWLQYGPFAATPKSRSVNKQRQRVQEIVSAIQKMVETEVMAKHPEMHDMTDAQLRNVVRDYREYLKLAKPIVSEIKNRQKLSSKYKLVSDYELYLAFAGEVEARNVQKRLGMTAEERVNEPPFMTQDRADADQLVLRDWEGTPQLAVARIKGKEIGVAESEPLTTKEAKDYSKVKEVLSRVVGLQYPQLGQTKLVKIDGAFPNYFWRSNYSQSLKKVDKLWRAKVSAVPIIGDILKTTELGPKEMAEHLKKDPSFKNRADFYRCTTSFGIKRSDGIAIYPCDLLVMEMKGTGERYVYDIVRMQKPTLLAKSDLTEEVIRQLYEPRLTEGRPSTVGSIPNEGASGQGGKFAAGKKDQTETQQFKDWFAGSKVVDDAGKPLVVWHSTDGDFNVFDRSRIGSSCDNGMLGRGFYFADSENGARGYGANIRAFYLNAKKIYEMTKDEFLSMGRREGAHSKEEIAAALKEDSQKLTDRLRAEGYDGVKYVHKYRNDHIPQTVEYCVFDPTQIKSATDNIGTFDPKNPDVRFSAGRNYKDIDTDVITWRKPGEGELAMGETEQGQAGLAAGIEKKEALRPWTKKQSPADLAKPIAFDAADMLLFWKAVSGSMRSPHVQKGERIAGRKNAIGLNVGGGPIENDRIEIVSKLFGVLDKGDTTKLKEACVADGFFRDENPDWCAGQPKTSIKAEHERSVLELDKRTRELFHKRVTTGEGGEHYATEVLGHEIGHSLSRLPHDKNLGPVGNELRTLFDEMKAKFLRHKDPLAKKGEKTAAEEVRDLIAWWHGQEKMPEYYEKPEERFAELFGIFLTQPESVHSLAPKAYDLCVNAIGQNARLARAYAHVANLKWSGKSNDAVIDRLHETWGREAQEQYRELMELTKSSVSRWRDWFNYTLNNRFGPMFGISKRGIAAERKRLKEAVATGAMSAEEAADRLAAMKEEVDALKTSVYDWQRQSGGATRLMIAGFDEVKWNAEKEGVNWNDVRDYAHLMRVIELGGRATAHGVDPARAAAMLGDMARKMGAESWAKVEKTWKAYRAVYERFVLDDPNVKELFDDMTNKMLAENKHYVTMKHRMGVEEAADWKARIEAYRKGNSDAWDPCIDIQERLNKTFGGGAEGGGTFVLHKLIGSFEATEDPIASTMKRAIEIKESAARNHMLKQMSQTLRACGAKGVFDHAISGAGADRPKAVDGSVYGKLTYVDGGVKHEVIVPKVIYKSFKADPVSFGKFGAAMRAIRNTFTLWNPAFINRAYLVDKSSLETNIKGLHKAPIDILSEALCYKGIGVPLYMVNNYLARFTPIANTWVGKLLWNENTVNHYAHRAQKIANMVYEGKFGEHLAEARRLRENGDTARAAEIEQNVAICQDMMKRNVFQSAYQFNKLQSADTDDVLRAYGYRIGAKDAKTLGGKVWEKTKAAGRAANRFEEEQEAVTKIITYLYKMKQDEAAGRTSEKDAAARARETIEYGGTPDLAARGVMASWIENATGFFWNVRKEGTMRTARALKDHPTEWIVKNLAQTALPAVLKGLMLTGGLEYVIRKLFDDDEEKIKQSWWAAPVINHARWTQAAMKCVPGYYQDNYNVIPLAKFGDEVLSLRVKYSPEEFAIQNAIHTAMQKWGKDPTDPAAGWTTLSAGMWNELLPNLIGSNSALMELPVLIGPLVGINPYDLYRQRNVYDQTTWEARALAPGKMTKEVMRNFWNYSPLGSFVTTFKDGRERKLEDSEVPEWLDQVLKTPLVRMIPASMLTLTSSDSYNKALEQIDSEKKAYVRLQARDVLADCITKGHLGGFADGLKEVPNELKPLAIRYVIKGWRQYHADPKTLRLRKARNIKDPNLRKKALQWITDAIHYQD